MGPELGEVNLGGGSVGGHSGFSIGIPDPTVPQAPNGPIADRERAPGISLSQYASMHHTTRTAGAPSIDQVYRQQRTTSEGTVQVVLRKPTVSQHHCPLSYGAALPASSAALAPPPHHTDQLQQRKLAPVQSGAGDHLDDTTTAVSKAPEHGAIPSRAWRGDGSGRMLRQRRHKEQDPHANEPGVELVGGGVADSAANDNQHQRLEDEDVNDHHRQRIDVLLEEQEGEKEEGEQEEGGNNEDQQEHQVETNGTLDAAKQPTLSYASAAVGDTEGHRNANGADGGAAASLTSHHEGPYKARLQTADRLEEAEGGLLPPPAPTSTAATTAPARVASGVLMPAAMTPQQLQNMMAAWSRAKSAAPRKGDSSNSGNYRVLVGIKRKASIPAGGRPPMAPPAQIPRVAAGGAGSQAAAPTGGGGQQHLQQHLQACVSSFGGPAAANNCGEDPALAVEDAVSMVEHGLEADVDIDMACDAASKASREATAAASAADDGADGERRAEEVEGGGGEGCVPPCESVGWAQGASRASRDAGN